MTHAFTQKSIRHMHLWGMVGEGHSRRRGRRLRGAPPRSSAPGYGPHPPHLCTGHKEEGERTQRGGSREQGTALCSEGWTLKKGGRAKNDPKREGWKGQETKGWEAMADLGGVPGCRCRHCHSTRPCPHPAPTHNTDTAKHSVRPARDLCRSVPATALRLQPHPRPFPKKLTDTSHIHIYIYIAPPTAARACCPLSGLARTRL